MRLAGHVARVRERRGLYRIMMEKPKGKRRFGRPKHRWEDNIKDGSSGSGDMDWIELAQDRGKWRALVNVAMNLRFP
jgi:hypothetical protein